MFRQPFSWGLILFTLLFSLFACSLSTPDAPSKEARLILLDIEGVTLAPAFHTDTFEYSATVSATKAQTYVTASPVHQNAEVSGTGSCDLLPGLNRISIVVTAEDGESSREYVVSITREIITPEPPSPLQSLSIPGTVLSPAFLPEIHEYALSVPYAVSFIDIQAVPVSDNWTVTGAGHHDLDPGTTEIVIAIHSDESQPLGSYTIKVTREQPSADNALAQLSVRTETAFRLWNHFDQNEYTVDVDHTSETVFISADARSETALIAGTGSFSLAEGSQSFEITVTAQNGDVGTYKIIINKSAAPLSNDASLIALGFSDGIISPSFTPDQLKYDGNVSNSVTSVRVSASANDQNATVVISGGENLVVGINVVRIEVTAADGRTQREYRIDITRLPSSDAGLSGIEVSSGSLSPSFGAEVFEYSVTVGNEVTALTLTPYTNHSGATAVVEIPSPLLVGENSAGITVTAEDGITEEVYDVTIIRLSPPASDDCRLSSLTLSGGELTPAFAAEMLRYTCLIPFSQTTLTVDSSTSHSAASVQGNGKFDFPVGSSTVTLDVLAEDGITQRQYFIEVTREAPSQNADLSTLTISEGTLTPVFSKDETSYSVELPYHISEIRIDALADHPNARVLSTGSHSLIVGTTTISISVIAEDGKTVKNYNLSITRNPPCDDARLDSLSLSEGILNPAFHRDTRYYSASVPNSVQSLAVTAIPVEHASVQSGTGRVWLNTGTNAFSVSVIAEDGKTTDTYYFDIFRAYSTDSVLSDLTVQGHDLSPAFSPDTEEYSLEVDDSVESVRLNVQPNHPAASFENAYPRTEQLVTGENIITVNVTAEDGQTKSTYRINVNRLPSDDAALASLSAGEFALVPAFSPDILTYSVSVPNSRDSVNITGIASHREASISGLGNYSVNVGSQTVTISVTAEDGQTVQNYDLNINRQPSANTALASLSVDTGNLNPSFSPETTSYSLTLPYTQESITIAGTTADSTATVTGPGEYALDTGENILTVSVTAQDGQSVRNYRVTVTRAYPSENADLGSLSVNPGSLTPAFSLDQTEYTVDLPYTQESITIAGEAADSTATVSGVGEYVLDVGENILTVSVTAQDGQTLRNYRVTVTRAYPSENADLGSLSVNPGSLTPAFSPDQTEYTVDLPYTQETITIAGKAADSTATVTGPGEYALDTGENILTVSVTAQDGITDRTYRITVTRNDPSVGFSITLSGPEDETVTLSREDNQILRQSGILYIGVSENYDTYAWYIDGNPISGETQKSLSFSCADLIPGVHRMLVVVSRGNSYFSKSVIFSVIN